MVYSHAVYLRSGLFMDSYFTSSYTWFIFKQFLVTHGWLKFGLIYAVRLRTVGLNLNIRLSIYRLFTPDVLQMFCLRPVCLHNFSSACDRRGLMQKYNSNKRYIKLKVPIL